MLWIHILLLLRLGSLHSPAFPIRGFSAQTLPGIELCGKTRPQTRRSKGRRPTAILISAQPLDQPSLVGRLVFYGGGFLWQLSYWCLLRRPGREGVGPGVAGLHPHVLSFFGFALSLFHSCSFGHNAPTKSGESATSLSLFLVNDAGQCLVATDKKEQTEAYLWRSTGRSDANEHTSTPYAQPEPKRNETTCLISTRPRLGWSSR